MSDTLLFSPMTIRGVELKNRIVVPPMHQYSAIKGFPTDWHLMNAGKFAAGGAGLVVVESTKVERRGLGPIRRLGSWGEGVRRGRVDQSRAARLRHHRRSRHLGRCLHRAVETRGQIHQAAKFRSRNPAWPFRPQGARQGPV